MKPATLSILTNRKTPPWAIFSLLLFGLIGITSFEWPAPSKGEKAIISYVVDPATQHLAMYWKDADGEPLKNFETLKSNLKNQDKELVFAMNGGIYMEDLRPLGLYVEKGEEKKRLNAVEEAYGNFYMQPNGIFYLTTDNKGGVLQTPDFTMSEDVNYATQSGPMLLIEGNRHPDFTKGSKNTNIRNGVGILPDGKILFAISQERINFWDFATFFKEQGCENALYLDGFVSKTFMPDQNIEQMTGRFGVMIGEVK